MVSSGVITNSSNRHATARGIFRAKDWPLPRHAISGISFVALETTDVLSQTATAAIATFVTALPAQHSVKKTTSCRFGTHDLTIFTQERCAARFSHVASPNKKDLSEQCVAHLSAWRVNAHPFELPSSPIELRLCGPLTQQLVSFQKAGAASLEPRRYLGRSANASSGNIVRWRSEMVRIHDALDTGTSGATKQDEAGGQAPFDMHLDGVPLDQGQHEAAGPANAVGSSDPEDRPDPVSQLPPSTPIDPRPAALRQPLNRSLNVPVRYG